jgi:hypothetical protein
VLLPVQTRDRRLGLFIAAHLHETKPFRAPGIPVIDDLGRHHRAMLPEQLLQLRAIHAVAQVPDIKLLTHYGSPVNGQTFGPV